MLLSLVSETLNFYLYFPLRWLIQRPQWAFRNGSPGKVKLWKWRSFHPSIQMSYQSHNQTFSGDRSFRVHVPLTWRGIGGPQRALWRFLGFGTWFKGTAAMSQHLCDDFLGNWDSDVILDTGHRCILCENTWIFSPKIFKKHMTMGIFCPDSVFSAAFSLSGQATPVDGSLPCSVVPRQCSEGVLAPAV